jgi:hypothetical protein
MRKLAPLSLLLCSLFLAVPTHTAAQTAAPATSSATWDRLRFLLGTWEARTGSVGTAQAQVSGAYTFRLDLDGHAIVRTSTDDTCSGPQPFDCKHHDLLTLYRDDTHPDSATVLALYLDSEGHVIDYAVSTPDPGTAIFTSRNAAPNAPGFRLVYHLDGKVMTGKFQFAAPGTTGYKSYLEWSGVRR